MKYILLIGRILYSMIFIILGFNHFFSLNEMVQYTASMGVPAPSVATIISGLVILAGGLSILLGYKTKIGSMLLFAFLIVTALVMHSFWSIEDQMQSQIQLIMFLKNLSMAGGALLLYYFGTGPLSIEKKSENKS